MKRKPYKSSDTILFRKIIYNLHLKTENQREADKTYDDLRKDGFRVRRKVKCGVFLIYKSKKI